METQTTTAGRPVHLEAKIRPGKSIQELASALQHIEETKRDFNVPVEALTATVIQADLKDSDGVPITGQDQRIGLQFKNGHDHNFALNQWSGTQVAQFTDIPTQYFKRISDESPELLAKNINHGLKMITRNDETKSRLVRTIGGNVRGFLSHRYRMLDSFDLMNAVLPMLIEHKFEVVSCELTDKRLYLKTATRRIQGEVKQGDVLSYGVMISTSDVGAGSLRVEPFFLRLACLNGMVSESKFRRAHLGRSNAEREVMEIMTDSTKQLNNAAFFATVRDYMAHTMKPEIFHEAMNKMRDASERQIKNLDLESVVEVTMKTVGVTGQKVKEGIMYALADGGQGAGLTQWGLLNSFTAAAKMPEIDYDQATDLERAGGQILNLTKAQWQRIAEPQH